MTLGDLPLMNPPQKASAEDIADALAQLGNVTNDCISISMPDGRLTYLNNAGRRMVGLEGADISGVNIADWLPPEQRQMLFGVALPSARENGLWEGEMQFVHLRTGAPIDVFRAIFALRGPDGEITGFGAVSRDISGYKETVRRLRENEALRRGLFSESADCQKVLDQDGRLIELNEGCLALLGARDAAAAIGQPLENLWREEDRPRARAAVEQAKATGVGSFTGMTGGQSPRWWDVRITRVPLDGRPPVLLASSRDITQRVSEQRRLAQATERLEYALAAAQMMAWDWEPETDTIEHTALGHDVARRVSSRSSFLQIIHPDDRARVEEECLRDFLTGEQCRVEFRYVAPDGSVRWVQAYGRASDDPDRRRRMRGVVFDVTARHDAETRLRESETRLWQSLMELEQLYAQAPLGLAMLDRDLRFLRINKALATINGFSIEEHLGRWVWDLVPEVRAEAEPPLRKVLDTGEPLLDVRIVGTTAAQPGVEREWREHFYPMKDEIGATIGVGIVCEEVTERVRLERELRTLNETLETRVAEEVERRETAMAALAQAQKMKALGQLTSGIAHDFNNLIQAISGGFTLIEKWSDNPRVKEVARQSVRAAERGSSLVRQLLAFARKQRMEQQIVDLTLLLPETKAFLERAAGNRHTVQLTCETGACCVRIDPGLLESALINLVVNARDAMPDGGIIDLSATTDPQTPCHVLIAVRDSGGGMSPDVLTRATEPFFTTKANAGGTGLGLAMVHGFAEQSGGEMLIDSTPGVGTTITLRLPCASPEAIRQDLAPLVSAADGRGHVLLVDDDDLVRSTVAFMLQDAGFAVTQAESGEAALALASGDHGFDVMLTDVAMPGLDGPGLVAQLRAGGWARPVVFMTGHARDHVLDAETVLHKPFEEGELRDVLSAAIRAHRA